jgi:CBS domain-containing protein
MTRPVHTVLDTDPLDDAVAVLANKRITAVPVVDAGDTVVGMISEGDLLRWRTGYGDTRPGATALDAMNPYVVSVPPEADTGQAAAAMLQHAVHSLPVLDNGRLVGIISRGDLLRTLVPSDHQLHREIQHRLDEYGHSERRWHVHVSNGAVLVGGEFDDSTERAIVAALARTVPGVNEVVVSQPGGELRSCG